MHNLTAKESAALKAFIVEGVGCTGAVTARKLIEDNMTFLDPVELSYHLKVSIHEAGRLITSLAEKGMISDTGEPLPERRHNAWLATDEGIIAGWDL